MALRDGLEAVGFLGGGGGRGRASYPNCPWGLYMYTRARSWLKKASDDPDPDPRTRGDRATPGDAGGAPSPTSALLLVLVILIARPGTKARRRGARRPRRAPLGDQRSARSRGSERAPSRAPARRARRPPRKGAARHRRPSTRRRRARRASGSSPPPPGGPEAPRRPRSSRDASWHRCAPSYFWPLSEDTHCSGRDTARAESPEGGPRTVPGISPGRNFHSFPRRPDPPTGHRDRIHSNSPPIRG